MGPDERDIQALAEFINDQAGEGDEPASFWELIQECVEVTYTADPPERLGVVRAAMIERFGPINSPIWTRVENTVIRLVCWMSLFDKKAEL